MKKLVCFTICILCSLSPFLAVSQNGLKAEFYDGTNFNRLATVRMVEKIDMYWNNTPPVPGIDPHECSIRWTGRLKAPASGTYQFHARVDDGIRVWVGDEKVIDNWGLNDVGIFSGEVEMEAGKMYDLKVEYFNALIEGEITLLWNIPRKEKSWFDRWFTNEAEVIEAAYYFLPKESVPAIVETQPVQRELKPETAKPTAKPTVDPPKKSTPKPSEPIKEMANTETIKKYTPENIQFE